MFRNTVWRGLKLLTVGSAISGTTYYLHQNEWTVNNIGPIRFGRAALAISMVVVDYKRAMRGLEYGTDEYAKNMSETHVRSAIRLREMCCKNGGAFIKVGQHIGALEYLLPKEYVDVMKVLHSNAPQSPLLEIKKVIKEDLGKDVDELFTSFEERPQGTASLAQVHKAVLKNGHVVAVKVQHPQVRAHSVVDIASMELLVNIVAWIFPDFQFLWLAELTKKNLPLELDFAHEGRNCERMAHMFKDFDYIKVPRIMWGLTTGRVLTMEFCEGGQVNDKQYMQQHHIDVNEVSQKLGRLYSEMIFVHGYVHCDPHPGNVLVSKTDGKTRIVLLDHGLYQTLTDDFRLKYCKLWQSILERNVNGIKKYAQKLGTGDLFPLFACMLTARSWKAVERGINTADNRELSKEEDDEIRDNVSQYLPQISDVLNRVPRPMLLLFKTNDLLRGIETHLNTRANASSFITMSKCCVHAVYEHKRKQCDTRFCKLKLLLEEYWKIFRITCFEFYLWYTDKKVLVSNQEIKDTVKGKAEEIYRDGKERAKEKLEEHKEKLEERKEILKNRTAEIIEKKKSEIKLKGKIS